MTELEIQRSVKKYSTAILQIATEKKMLDVLNKDMHKLRVFFEIIFANDTTRKDYLIISRNFAILPYGKKINILKNIANDVGINGFTYNFLTLLLHSKKLYIIQAMASEWEQIFLEYQGYFKVEVRSVVPTSKAQETKIKKLITKHHGEKFYLEKIIDKSILGGLILTFKGYTYDNSLRGKLVKIKSA
ncbi:ATP synthase subunit delta [Candidatus Hepatincola sp. Av]